MVRRNVADPTGFGEDARNQHCWYVITAGFCKIYETPYDEFERGGQWSAVTFRSDRTIANPSEISERATTARKQNNHGWYVPFFNTDWHFVQRMVTRLDREQWLSSPSEVVTKDVVALQRFYSELELEVADVVSVLRTGKGPRRIPISWFPFYHVGVVVSKQESGKVQILQRNTDFPTRVHISAVSVYQQFKGNVQLRIKRRWSIFGSARNLVCQYDRARAPVAD